VACAPITEDPYITKLAIRICLPSCLGFGSSGICAKAGQAHKNNKGNKLFMVFCYSRILILTTANLLTFGALSERGNASVKLQHLR
jgi:hypothetical protein